jgi:hypothetical protein
MSIIILHEIDNTLSVPKMGQEVLRKHWYLFTELRSIPSQEYHNRNLHSEENLTSHTAMQLHIDVTKLASLKRQWKGNPVSNETVIYCYGSFGTLTSFFCGSLSVGRVCLWTKGHRVCFYIVIIRPPQWCSGESSWLQIQRFWVWFLALSEFLRSSGSTNPREDNWEAAWMK